MDTSPEISTTRSWNHYYEGELAGAHAEVMMEDSPKPPEEMPETIGEMHYVRSEYFTSNT